MRAWSAEHPTALAALAYGLVAIAAAVTAFFVLFNQFAFYDDEGTLLVAVQAFADGQALYRDIYAAYGPFFFDVFGGFFALTGIGCHQRRQPPRRRRGLGRSPASASASPRSASPAAWRWAWRR